MVIWRLGLPVDGAYAVADRRGAWARPEPCPAGCDMAHERRVQPLVIEWQKGSDLVGDFTVTGVAPDDIAVSARTGQELHDRYAGFDLGPVEMITTRSVPRRAKIVRLPYAGPKLLELWATAYVHLDPARSSVTLARECSVCGRSRWNVRDIERIERGYDRVKGEGWVRRIPRPSGKGAIIPAERLEGIDIFRLYELPGWICCTDRVRDFVLERSYTNASFFEVGETG